MRTVYLNGDFLPEAEAKISPFDRGFLFADAIYEVVAVIDAKLVDFEGHFVRLERSLADIKMPLPMDREKLVGVLRGLVQHNDLVEGVIYLQVSRGVAERDFAFPAPETPQTFFAMTQTKNLTQNTLAEAGLRVVTLDDLRWRKCDVKTVQLLYPSLAKMEAKALGADDAWLVSDGFVTEGTSNNAYIVTHEGEIITRNLGSEILAGITRTSVLACAKSLGYTVVERAFTPQEAEEAKEAFITSASTFVMPVVQINNHVLGNGAPGPVAEALRIEYLKVARQTSI